MSDPFSSDPDTFIGFDKDGAPHRKKESRELKRIKCDGSIVVYADDGRIKARGVLKEINERGFGAEFEHAVLSAGEVATVEVDLTVGIVIPPFKATITTIYESHIGTQNSRIGVQFKKLTTAQKRKLQEFIAELIRKSEVLTLEDESE